MFLLTQQEMSDLHSEYRPHECWDAATEFGEAVKKAQLKKFVEVLSQRFERKQGGPSDDCGPCIEKDVRENPGFDNPGTLDCSACMKKFWDELRKEAGLA